MLLKQFAKKINNEKGKYYCERSACNVYKYNLLSTKRKYKYTTDRKIHNCSSVIFLLSMSA